MNRRYLLDTGIAQNQSENESTSARQLKELAE
jgi:hypothetical protein